jgi:short subunit dehydrogenase-like uncharacterized protein
MSIAVYGATGFTGELVVRELAQMGADVVLSGRDAHKLERAAQHFAPETSVRPARADDPPALRALLRGQRVLVNCAPTGVCGEPLVNAALEAGVHYVDASGDQSFIRKLFEHYDVAARQRGVALVPGAGFDYAPGDCLARVVADRLDPVDELVVAYALDGAGVSNNSARGAAQSDHVGEVVYQKGMWRPPSFGVWRASFPFPAPVGRRPVTRYGSGEVVMVPRHTQVNRVVSVITTTSFAPHPALVGLFPYLRPAATLALRTPLRALLGLALAHNRDSSPPGPTPADRATARFVIAVVARDEEGSVSQGVAHGIDSYGLTAAALAHGATRLTDQSFGGTGTLSPASAYDPARFLDALAPHGLQWELQRPPRAWDLHPLW